MEQVEINGLRIVYERAGAGPPLVLLHGLVGDGRSTWQRQLDDLSDEFTVVAWDGPGAGRSADPPASFRLPDYADCLAGFVNALGLTSPHVAGFSFGGALALELYHRWPRMPKSLTLAGAYAGWGGSLPLPVVEHRLWQSFDIGAGEASRGLRRVGGGISSRRVPNHGARVRGSGPARCPASDRRADTPLTRRRGRARPASCRRCPPCLDSLVEASRHDRGRPYEQR